MSARWPAGATELLPVICHFYFPGTGRWDSQLWRIGKMGLGKPAASVEVLPVCGCCHVRGGRAGMVVRVEVAWVIRSSLTTFCSGRQPERALESTCAQAGVVEPGSVRQFQPGDFSTQPGWSDICFLQAPRTTDRNALMTKQSRRTRLALFLSACCSVTVGGGIRRAVGGGMEVDPSVLDASSSRRPFRA